MPTQSEPLRRAPSDVRSGVWAARSDTPRRSVFGNYSPAGAGSRRREEAQTSSADAAKINQNFLAPAVTAQAGLQSAIDTALARSFIYRFLAKAYEDPTPEGWQWLWSHATQESMCCASRAVAASRECAVVLSEAAADLLPLQSAAFSKDAATEESFHSAYVAAFGHAARGRCPMNEIEYGDIKADPLFQPHRLADLAAFYRAFGLEIAGDADERQDHICLELEFMTVLAAKDAYALEHQLDAEELRLCRDAQKRFLREHLGRWAPAFTRRLAAATDHPTLTALANFTRAFVETECACFGVNLGSEDLLLRPVNEAEESMCASCGVAQLPPGASAPAVDL